METRDLVILAAGALVVVAALTVATTSDVLEPQSTDDPWNPDGNDAASTACGPTTVPAFPSGTEVETWTEPVPADANGGTLDLQSYRGGIVVIPWDRHQVQAQVALDDPDDELEPRVDISTTGGTLTVQVHVREKMAMQQGPVYASPNRADDARAYITLRVPHLAYEDVNLRDRPGGGDQVALRPPSTDTNDDGGNAFPTRVARLTASAVSVDMVNAAVDLVHLAVDGPVHVDTVNGAVCAARLTASDTTVDTTNGAVTLLLDPSQDGQVTASTTNGAVEVLVPTGQRYGYDVQADTTNGDITIDLPDADVDREDGYGGESAHARTRGYEDRAVQVQVDADTTNGSIVVAGLGR